MSAGQLVAVAVAALALRLFVAWALPLGIASGDPNCAPDEVAHFIVVRELASGRARTWPDVPSSESLHLPSQYVLQAAIFAMARAGADQDWLYRFSGWHPYLEGYPFARLGNVVLGVLTVVMLASAAATWTGSAHAGLIAGLVVAFYPQHIFISSYVNADAMTIAAGAALVLALARWVRAGEGERGLSLLGAAAGLVALGRVNGYAVLPATLVWVGWAMRRRRVRLGDVLRAVSVALAVCGPVLAFNAVRNSGDPLGLSRYREYLSRDWQVTPPPPDAVRAFIARFSESSFALFRNMDLRVQPVFYDSALVLLTVGLVMAGFGIRSRDRTLRAALLWIVASTAGSVALVAYYSWFVDFAPQGRYALLPILLLTVIAVLAPGCHSPRRVWRLWPAAYLAFLVAAGVHAAWVIYTNPCV